MIPPVANRFVAGESPEDVLTYTQQLNQDNINAIVNLLGEHYHERPPADEDMQTYLKLVQQIDAWGVNACISVKPSQIGIDVSSNAFTENLRRIHDTAADSDIFLWVDMEDHTTTDTTLDAVESLASGQGAGIGVCLQANLKRTRDDLERLAGLPVDVRLVKGAYDEPPRVAYQDKSAVNRNYKECLRYAFREFSGSVAVGSHDPDMISLAAGLHEEFGTDFQYQMLMGVREDAQRELAESHETWQYVPYGSKWASYFYRRVMERKENLLFAARAVLGV